LRKRSIRIGGLVGMRIRERKECFLVLMSSFKNKNKMKIGTEDPMMMMMMMRESGDPSIRIH